MDTSLPKNANKIQEVQENTTKAKDALGSDKLLTAHDTNLSHQMDKLALPHKEKELIADGHLPDSKFKPGTEKNDNGQVEKVTYPDGNSRSFEYNDKGEITKVASTSQNGEDFVRQQNPDGTWSDKWTIIPKSGKAAYEATFKGGKDSNGQDCPDISVDASGNLKWRFADGREHKVDDKGTFKPDEETEGPNGEKFYRGKYGHIEKILTKDSAGNDVETTFTYDSEEGNAPNGITETTIKTTTDQKKEIIQQKILKKTPEDGWAYYDANGNIVEKVGANGQKYKERIPMDFVLDQGNGLIQARKPEEYWESSIKGGKQGWLSSMFEGNGSAGMVNMDPNRASGWDYGPWQMNQRAGTPKSFVNWTKNNAPDIYEKLAPHTRTIGQGTAGAFGQEWQEIAQEDGARFKEVQRQFMLNNYLKPLVEGFSSRLADNGILQEHAYALSVQFGPQRASQLMARAGALDSTLSDAQYTQNLVNGASSAYPPNESRYRKEGRAVLRELS